MPEKPTLCCVSDCESGGALASFVHCIERFLHCFRRRGQAANRSPGDRVAECAPCERVVWIYLERALRVAMRSVCPIDRSRHEDVPRLEILEVRFGIHGVTFCKLVRFYRRKLNRNCTRDFLCKLALKR